jgi:hypothetical protein
VLVDKDDRAPVLLDNDLMLLEQYFIKLMPIMMVQ